jgi:hypothetical protein
MEKGQIPLPRHCARTLTRAQAPPGPRRAAASDFVFDLENEKMVAP